MEKKLTAPKLFLFSSLTLIFFALNSIFCRLALDSQSIDAFSFTLLRLFFGAITLLFILKLLHQTRQLNLKGDWASAFLLFCYAIFFSYAYINLDAGLGALILFVSVQFSLILLAWKNHEHFTPMKLLGIAIAFAGLIYLLFPKDDFELSLPHALLMMLSGLAWAGYTYLGKNSHNAMIHTTNNFIKALAFIPLAFIFHNKIIISFEGIVWAFLSGAITSAIGYALWYSLLGYMKILTASIIQLTVPLLAIILGVLLLKEPLTPMLILSAVTILSGILIYLVSKN